MGALLGYLVLDQPRQRASHWATALAPLEEPRAPLPLRVDGYYLAAEDRALIGLWFLADDGDAATIVDEVVRLAEIPVLDPRQLAEPDRRALFERLQTAEVAIEKAGAVGEVFVELVRRARELRVVTPARTITDRSLAAASSSALATPSGSAASSASADGGLQVRITPTRERLPIPPAALASSPEPAPPPRDALALGTARGAQAALRDEISAARLGEREAGQRRPLGTRDDLGERPMLEATSDPFALAFEATAPTIEARVLRGGRWAPAQLSQLSLDSARLAAVSVPRLGDRVVLALMFSDAAVTVSGEVSYQSDDLEAQHVGACAFQVALSLDDGQRGRLGSLLSRARAAHAQLRPPAPRASRRFALTWPVTLGTPRGSIRAELHDVSAGGMFVQPLRELELSGGLGFSIVLDDLLSSVAGRARVVRHLSAAEARQRGLRSGYGLELTELTAQARLTWDRFVARVRRRNARRVLVGARATRFDEIASSLQGAGYSVTGGVDPAAVAQLAELERRPADAAVLDADWAMGPQPTWLADRLAARGVPCLTTHGDARRSYGEVDRLLGVVT